MEFRYLLSQLFHVFICIFRITTFATDFSCFQAVPILETGEKTTRKFSFNPQVVGHYCADPFQLVVIDRNWFFLRPRDNDMPTKCFFDQRMFWKSQSFSFLYIHPSLYSCHDSVFLLCHNSWNSIRTDLEISCNVNLFFTIVNTFNYFLFLMESERFSPPDLCFGHLDVLNETESITKATSLYAFWDESRGGLCNLKKTYIVQAMVGRPTVCLLYGGTCRASDHIALTERSCIFPKIYSSTNKRTSKQNSNLKHHNGGITALACC